MFKFFSKRSETIVQATSRVHIAGATMEMLEDRQFLSASHGFNYGYGGFDGRGGQLNSIQFSQAPSAVQTGLDKLAESDGLADPTSAQAVTLGNRDGIETYSVNFNSTGISTTLTVDQNGNPLTAPSTTTTTFGSLETIDAPAANEITAIASALNLTAPTTDSSVTVTTTLNGTVIYSVDLTPASTTTNPPTTPPTAAPVTMHMDHEFNFRDQLVSVDAAGNPVGNQNLPFSVIPSNIQAALNANAPSGATAFTSDSTQTVAVRTVDGTTTYSVTFSASGIYTTVTVDKNGNLTSLPSHTTTTFGALTMAVQTEIQALATANNITTTIDASQNVDVLTESNGTVIYSVSLPTSSTTPGGRTFTRQLTISVDASGNPTVLPGGDGRGFRGDDDGFGEGREHGHGDCDDDRGTSTTTPGSTGTSTTSSTGSSATAAVLTGTTTITNKHTTKSSKKPKPAPKPKPKAKPKPKSKKK